MTISLLVSNSVQGLRWCRTGEQVCESQNAKPSPAKASGRGFCVQSCRTFWSWSQNGATRTKPPPAEL